jgi:hypothetical protein
MQPISVVLAGGAKYELNFTIGTAARLLAKGIDVLDFFREDGKGNTLKQGKNTPILPYINELIREAVKDPKGVSPEGFDVSQIEALPFSQLKPLSEKVFSALVRDLVDSEALTDPNPPSPSA